LDDAALLISCAEAGLVLVAFDRATRPWHAGQVSERARVTSEPQHTQELGNAELVKLPDEGRLRVCIGQQSTTIVVEIQLDCSDKLVAE
jgi:hypothetical protein